MVAYIILKVLMIDCSKRSKEGTILIGLFILQYMYYNSKVHDHLYMTQDRVTSSDLKADVLTFKCFRIDKKSVLTHPRFM